MYEGMSDEEYHSDPVVGGSVSSSVLRQMTPPEGTPQHAWYYLTAERKEKTYFDLGSAFHTGILGNGREIEVLPAESRRSNAVQATEKKARLAGKIPLLPKEAELVRAMVAATRAHPEFARLLTPGTFTAELVIVWEDPATGVMCRAKLDAVPHYVGDMLVIDAKTKAGHADPGSVSAMVAKHAYHQQIAFYIAGVRAMIARGLLAPVETITPLLLVCGKEPPHVPLCRPMVDCDIEMGERQIRKALDLYATCQATGEWPGYDDPRSTKREPIGVPVWYRTRFHNDFIDGVYDVEDWL
jgi:hypothetical protein